MTDSKRIVDVLKRLNVQDKDVMYKHDAELLMHMQRCPEYHIDICRRCVNIVLSSSSRGSASDMTLIDLGISFGLLAVVAAQMGVGKVVCAAVYDENRPATEKIVSAVGGNVEIVTAHSVADVSRWCRAENIQADAVVAMNTVSEEYVLDDYFLSIRNLSPEAKVLFTTTANPYNRGIVRNLRKEMEKMEHGNEGYFELRRNYINKKYGGLSHKELDYWAANTRGLAFPDIERAVESQSPNLLLDPYNTCDPYSGRWLSRILPVDEYRQLLSQYGYTLLVMPGFYNEYEHGLKGIANRRHNRRLHGVYDIDGNYSATHTGKRILRHAPFLFMLAK